MQNQDFIKNWKMVLEKKEKKGRKKRNNVKLLRSGIILWGLLMLALLFWDSPVEKKQENISRKNEEIKIKIPLALQFIPDTLKEGKILIFHPEDEKIQIPAYLLRVLEEKDKELSVCEILIHKDKVWSLMAYKKMLSLWAIWDLGAAFGRKGGQGVQEISY